MIFTETKLSGVFIIEPERLEDDRGFFARVFDEKVFRQKGIEFNLVESSVSFNKKKGTLRGMHYQARPHAESKIVRCTMGKIYDVVIDLRPKSKTFKKWFAIELTAENRRMLFIPKGLAHGFMTLEDNCEIEYQMDQAYVPESSTGIKYDDKEFGVVWPMEPEVISPKDLAWKPFTS